ncbi:hypothetical protein DI53_2910 [Sphingobacterium deserti]|uniref:Uncharacterized protein n=1 Tax=Sphingobacterium deserti TaxID=1229276 RepID=A0A0B8T666_9SPHI|nr:hypothetical protein DI53_2910 [Sphingobacterium deserti]
MIDLVLNNNTKYSVRSVDEIRNEKLDFVVIQFHDHSPEDIDWQAKTNAIISLKNGRRKHAYRYCPVAA